MGDEAKEPRSRRRRPQEGLTVNELKRLRNHPRAVGACAPIGRSLTVVSHVRSNCLKLSFCGNRRPGGGGFRGHTRAYIGPYKDTQSTESQGCPTKHFHRRAKYSLIFFTQETQTFNFRFQSGVRSSGFRALRAQKGFSYTSACSAEETLPQPTQKGG